MITEFSTMDEFLVISRGGYFDDVLNMFAYLQIKHSSRMVFDPTYPDIDMNDPKECNWKDFYKTAKEEIPGNSADPRGKDIDLRVFIDLDHASDTITRRPRTWFSVCINISLVCWYSKKQSNVETSSVWYRIFGHESCNGNNKKIEV